jgi:hypothetical protein
MALYPSEKTASGDVKRGCNERRLMMMARPEILIWFSASGQQMLTVIPVSPSLPVSSVLSACYCLDRRCVFKSLATPRYDRIISSTSTTYVHTCLLRATFMSLTTNITNPFPYFVALGGGFVAVYLLS